MSSSPIAGESALTGLSVDPARLEREYYDRRPDVDDPDQLVSFGPGGHRGSPAEGTFTEAHVRALAQAVCDYRRGRGIDGPVYVGKDAHGLSAPGQRTTLEVLAANGAPAVIQRGDGPTPAPVISWAVLAHNQRGTDHLADGVVLAPSHDPATDGGFRYILPTGAPADVDAARWIEERANELLLRDNAGGGRVPYETAVRAPTTRQEDFVRPYVDDLRTVIDLDAIRAAGLTLGADPLGGAAGAYWQAIREVYGLNVGVVTPARLTCPSDFLAVAVRYLLTHRPGWPARGAVGRTVVGSGLIDRVAGQLGRPVYEAPVGFTWFAGGLFDGSVGFAGEGTGATFLRYNGTVWTTDGDEILMALLAVEIAAVTGKDPDEHYRGLTAEFGTPYYTRADTRATPDQKARLRKLSPQDVPDSTLAGEPITARLTRAPGNDAPIGGLKVVTACGWFAALPSGTEDVFELYAETFEGPAHLEAIVADGQRIVAAALNGKGR